MVAGDGRGGRREVWNCGHTSLSAWSFGPHWGKPLFSPASVALSVVEGTLERAQGVWRGDTTHVGVLFPACRLVWSDSRGIVLAVSCKLMCNVTLKQQRIPRFYAHVSHTPGVKLCVREKWDKAKCSAK